MEFNIIDKYFNWKNQDKTIIKSVGDDCAVLNNCQKNPKKLIISTDTFIEGVHFFKDTSPSDIAYKSLAVNLSDVSSMGGTPKYFTLNLTLPNFDENWLQKFSKSLKNLADDFNVNLIGGDTTKGNLSITITIIGECENPLMRNGARVGDSIFVSGELGGAKLALEQIKAGKNPNKLALQKLNKPFPRVELGQKISANSCIDISDGLVSDLSHILKSSGVGANLQSANIPVFKGSNLEYALYGGDDYELCWTGKNSDFGIKIGEITTDKTTNKTLKLDNKIIEVKGYNHF
jgi:thiamine-monophosphate kinase